MPRIAWMTDVHLEFLSSAELEKFFDSLAAQKFDGLMLTGDIAQAKTITGAMRLFGLLEIPVYFVLGNHDYYGGDIAPVRAEMSRLTREDLHLFWMPEVGIVELAPGVALVGHGAWADGRYGHFLKSPVILNDYLLIASLRTPSDTERLARLNALGDEAAAFLRKTITQAAQQCPRVFVLMHPPPFMEACWHKGKVPDENDVHLPHFSCKAVGDVLLEMAAQYPQVTFTVLCGHTHGDGTAQIMPNLSVFTGAAEYGKPAVNRVFTF